MRRLELRSRTGPITRRSGIPTTRRWFGRSRTRHCPGVLGHPRRETLGARYRTVVLGHHALLVPVDGRAKRPRRMSGPVRAFALATEVRGGRWGPNHPVLGSTSASLCVHLQYRTCGAAGGRVFRPLSADRETRASERTPTPEASSRAHQQPPRPRPRHGKWSRNVDGPPDRSREAVMSRVVPVTTRFVVRWRAGCSRLRVRGRARSG
jgi:hypothetical protein